MRASCRPSEPGRWRPAGGGHLRHGPSAARRAARTAVLAGLVGLAPLAGSTAAAGQDGNYILPPDTIEARLAGDDFRVLALRASRGIEGERTSQATLELADGTVMLAKWAVAPRGGDAFNNSPRYELAAYRLQPLLFEPDAYVVPPTVLRPFDLDGYRAIDRYPRATFQDTESVLVVLQYWLLDVSGDDVWDPERFATDTAYARHLADFNIFTYLVRHSDENEGNYLISRSGDPRVFSVDNGIAFASEESDRGADWRRIRVDRLPAATIDRLRSITLADLTARLETVAELGIGPEGHLTPRPPGPAIDPDRGVRRTDDVIQLGLTRGEIRGVWRRIRSLLEQVDRGEYELF